MAKRLRTWWRILAICAVVLIVVVNAVVAVVMLRNTPASLVYVPACTTIALKIEPARQSVEDQELARQMTEILRARIDPTGLRGLEWRPLKGNRIEVRMPAPSDDSQKSLKDYKAKLDSLTANPITNSRLDEIEKLPANQQQEQITQISASNKMQGERVAKLLKLKEQLDRQAKLVAELEAKTPATTQPATQPTDPGWDLQKAKNDLYDTRVGKYLPLRQEIRQSNMTAQALGGIFANYISGDEAKALKMAGHGDEVSQRTKAYSKDIQDLLQKHPDRRDDILAMVKSYEMWAGSRQQSNDPDDLIRLILRRGVLEFRVAPRTLLHEIPDSEAQQYKDRLQSEGAQPGRDREDLFIWLPAHSLNEKFAEQGLITAYYDGREYVLLHNSQAHVMLSPPGSKEWSLDDAHPGVGYRGDNVINFTFDPRGANKFSELTKNHLQQPMAILLDDEVYSAPVIQAVISKNGEIAGNFTRMEAEELANTLRSGSLPAKINPQAVTITEEQRTLPQQASLKIGLLMVLAILAIAALALALYAAIAGRQWAFFMGIVIAAVSWSAWCGVTAWNNFANATFSHICLVVAAASAIVPVITWGLGFLTSARPAPAVIPDPPQQQ